jgi:hypothetical protein
MPLFEKYLEKYRGITLVFRDITLFAKKNYGQNYSIHLNYCVHVKHVETQKGYTDRSKFFYCTIGRTHSDGSILEFGHMNKLKQTGLIQLG